MGASEEKDGGAVVMSKEIDEHMKEVPFFLPFFFVIFSSSVNKKKKKKKKKKKDSRSM